MCHTKSYLQNSLQIQSLLCIRARFAVLLMMPELSICLEESSKSSSISHE